MNNNALNEKLYDSDIERMPIRNGFGEGLRDAGRADHRIVGLCADLTESTRMNLFADEFPHRFIEIGVAEQNLASVASGMAAMGKVPFISSYAMFSPGRNWEQIRTTILYNNRKVIIVGSHAGISVGPDGGTHQAIEDIAITRVLPRMQVIVPCDTHEAYRATIASATIPGSFYIRLARENTPVMTTKETPFEFGKAMTMCSSENSTVGIIACGSLVYNALIAARALEKEGIAVDVLNLHTIKPLDREAIIALAKKTERIITIEEHQRAGGMGSAVAECLSEALPTPMRIMGIDDQFGQSGEPDELLEHYGLSVQHIISLARNFVA